MNNTRKLCTGVIASGAFAAAIAMAGPAAADDTATIAPPAPPSVVVIPASSDDPGAGGGASPGAECGDPQTGTTADAPQNACAGGGVVEGTGPGESGYNGIDPRG